MNENTEHPQLIFNPLLLLAIAIVLTVALGKWQPLPFFAQTPARIIGAALFVGGFLFGLPAFRGMRRAGTSPNPNLAPTALVEGGTYKFTRNPMYLGMLVTYAGLCIFLQDAWFVVLMPLVVWLLTVWVIIPEERYLARKFGTEYDRFMKRVPRWV